MHSESRTSSLYGPMPCRFQASRFQTRPTHLRINDFFRKLPITEFSHKEDAREDRGRLQGWSSLPVRIYCGEKVSAMMAVDWASSSPILSGR